MCKMHQNEQMTNELFTEISSEISSELAGQFSQVNFRWSPSGELSGAL